MIYLKKALTVLCVSNSLDIGHVFDGDWRAGVRHGNGKQVSS